MNYIGMDIHKQFTVAVVKDEQGNKLAEDKLKTAKITFALNSQDLNCSIFKVCDYNRDKSENK